MSQNISALPNEIYLVENVDNCVLHALMTAPGALGGGGAPGSATQATFESANPALGNFNFDAALGMTQGAGAQAIQYGMSNAALQAKFINYTISFTIDKTFYTSAAATDRYAFSTTGANALSYSIRGVNGKHVYEESGVNNTGTNPNIYTYPENKPAQIQHVLIGNPTRYYSYVDGLKILSGPRTFTQAAWSKFFGGSITVSTDGIGTNHMRDLVLQSRTVTPTPGRIKSAAWLGHSFLALSSVPNELFALSNYIDWIPAGNSGGKGYTAGDVLVPVGAAIPSGTAGSITVTSVDFTGAIRTATGTGGATYIPGSIIPAVTGGTGSGARFTVASIGAGGAIATLSSLNPYGYQGGGLVTTGGYNMFQSDAGALTAYSRGDTSMICQAMRALYKAGHYPIANAHRSEAGGTLQQIIGVPYTGRDYLSGFEAMKTADNVHPDILFITIGANEAIEALSGGVNFNAFEARYQTLLTNAMADGVQLCVIDEVLSVANNQTLYSNPAYENRVIALNAIVNSLPAWAVSQGFRMKVVVNPVYAKFGGATPLANLFRPGDIHLNAFGSSLSGASAGQVGVTALRSRAAPGTPFLSPLFGPGMVS